MLPTPTLTLTLTLTLTTAFLWPDFSKKLSRVASLSAMNVPIRVRVRSSVGVGG